MAESRNGGAEKVRQVLLVGQPPQHVEFLRATLASLGARAELWLVRDHQEALDFLSKVGAYRSAKQADLVLYDLSLPQSGMDGFEDVRFRAEAAGIPVVGVTIPETTKDEEPEVGAPEMEFLRLANMARGRARF